MQPLRFLNLCEGCFKIQKTLVLNALSQRNVHDIPTLQRSLQSPRRFLMTKVHSLDDETLIDKLKLKFKLFVYRSRLNIQGFILYESVADKIDYLSYFRLLDLPDTFYSWFVITELHLWMIIARLMAEGEEGKLLRKRIVSSLWNDVQQRSKKLGEANPAGLREQVRELSEQFPAALIAYDEGLQSDDTTLAAAIWRRIYQYKNTDPENIECLVKYIRQEMKRLELISKEELVLKGNLQWEISSMKDGSS